MDVVRPLEVRGARRRTMQYRKPVLTLLVIVLAFKLMVTAFSLMNQPSDAALYGGEALLVLTAIGSIASVRLLWRRSTQ
jgi:hypothetical protein